MYTKWLAAVLASVGLVLVSCQTSTVAVANVTDDGVTNVTTTTTTTLAPKTTTTSPTTTTTQSTTSVAPTPPPTPPPRPAPETWAGNVTNGNNTCINVKFSIVIDISYNTTNNTETATGFIFPSNASLDMSNSYCTDNDSLPEAIAIRFEDLYHTSANLTLVFNKTDKEVRVHSIKLSFLLTNELFPDFHDKTLIGTVISFETKDLDLFKVSADHSYVCGAAQSAELGSLDKDINDVKISFTDSKVEAYIEKTRKGDFDSEIDCKSAEISDVVPIAVGAALAGLVVIVLIAYFIGRRRSRRLAYQSV